MGLYMFDAPHTCFTNFFWSFFLAWILALTGALTPWWILFLGLAVVFFHKALPTYDFGAANVFGRWVGGMTGKLENGASTQEFLFTILFQFGGALVGAILYNWIFDVAPVPEPAMFLTKPEGKIFILFGFANFFQAYCINRLVIADTSLDNSMRLATAYTLSWVLCQTGFSGSIGGMTIDFGRLLAGKMIHPDSVSDDTFEKFWLLLCAPLAGWAVCFLYQMLEYSMKAKENGDKKDDDAPAAADQNTEITDVNAEENAKESV